MAAGLMSWHSASSTVLGNAYLFTKFLFTIFAPLNLSPPNQQSDGFPLEFLLKPLKGTSNRIANTQTKLRTNLPKIANKQNYEQTGVSEVPSFSHCGALRGSCAARGGRVAWRIVFCYFWSVFSKRTLLTKSVVLEVRSKPCPSHQLQLRDCMHFNMGASTMPRRQPRVSQNPCSEDASKSNPSQSKKPGVYLEVRQADLLVGFAVDFWAWLADFGGVVRRRIFWFRLADFPADFSFVFCDQKYPPQIAPQNPPLPWQSFGRLSTLGWTPDRPWANSKFSTGTLPVSLKLEPGLSAHFFLATSKTLRNSWSMATAPLEIPRQAGFKPHSLTGQEIAHLKARRQAEIYTSKKRWHHQIHCKFGGKAIKIKKIEKFPENRLCWNGSLTRECRSYTVATALSHYAGPPNLYLGIQSTAQAEKKKQLQ